MELVRDALLGVIGDDHHEALIKCLRIWSTVQEGSFRASVETIDLLKDYPNNPRKRAQADTTVRAMWSAHKGLLEHEDPNSFDAATNWARMFWGANSMTSGCIRERDLESLTGTFEASAQEAL